jgi:hypothetical protein
VVAEIQLPSNPSSLGLLLRCSFPPQEKKVDPASVAAWFKAQFTPAPTSNWLITIPSNNCDVSHFLSLRNWFQEVEGLTGREAYDITQNSLPNLWGLVCQSMNLYVGAMDEEL